ncbi:Uncharacterised protein [Yersinia enterocolitica]|nr:Uncharacterised protein [Yersinia enterocolitica]CNC73774.1 Uncharacterised protein [Yersinia enterocolitica]CNC91166.1 Uncharacterised protein [Yersinia enterocolitica]CND31739.1 Uncharacterised protein [Yersinia enterocolitica]CND43779.1 Uncharacterised protein [Yersinia enterocolitica]
MGGEQRAGKSDSADGMGQESLREAKRDGGKELRGCKTASWAPLRAVPRVDESANAVLVGGSRAKHQEDGAAGAILLFINGVLRSRQGNKVVEDV